MHNVKLLRNDGGEMSGIDEENSLRQFCIYTGDAKSRVLQCSTRAVFIVGSVEIVVVQCL